MKLKTYFAGTVESAMELARQELGPDSMIVYSRRADKENRHLGEYEVVFAMDETTAESQDPVTQASSPSLPLSAPFKVPPDEDTSLLRFSMELGELRRQMERISGAMHRTTPAATPEVPELNELLAILIEDGLDAQIAQEVTAAVQASLPAKAGGLESGGWERAVAKELAKRFETSADAASRQGRRILAMVGPPGAGKTLTLVKLAATYGLMTRRPAQIISTDNVRIGASDQLRTYASILGIQFRMADTTRALAQSLEEFQSRELILIDTPGYSPRDIPDASALGMFFTQKPEIEVHLVLTATTKSADLLRAVERFRIFRPDHLIFTRVDETASYGSIVNTAIRSSLPLSYFTNGQAIPEDLEPATKRRLLGLLLTSEAGSAVAAA